MRSTPTHVFSTCTSAIVVCKYSDYIPNQVPQLKAKVTILGGANLPQGHRTANMLWTPKGIATPITEADYDLLMGDENFLKMVSDGYMSFGNFANDAEAAAKSMRPKDGSAPKTAEDYKGLENNVGGRGIKVGRAPEAIFHPG